MASRAVNLQDADTLPVPLWPSLPTSSRHLWPPLPATQQHILHLSQAFLESIAVQSQPLRAFRFSEEQPQAEEATQSNGQVEGILQLDPHESRCHRQADEQAPLEGVKASPTDAGYGSLGVAGQAAATGLTRGLDPGRALAALVRAQRQLLEGAMEMVRSEEGATVVGGRKPEGGGVREGEHAAEVLRTRQAIKDRQHRLRAEQSRESERREGELGGASERDDARGTVPAGKTRPEVDAEPGNEWGVRAAERGTVGGEPVERVAEREAGGGDERASRDDERVMSGDEGEVVAAMGEWVEGARDLALGVHRIEQELDTTLERYAKYRRLASMARNTAADACRPVSPADVIAYAHKISYSTFAVPESVPGTAIWTQPPAPQEEHMRASALHAAASVASGLGLPGAGTREGATPPTVGVPAGEPVPVPPTQVALAMAPQFKAEQAMASEKGPPIPVPTVDLDLNPDLTAQAAGTPSKPLPGDVELLGLELPPMPEGWKPGDAIDLQALMDKSVGPLMAQALAPQQPAAGLEVAGPPAGEAPGVASAQGSRVAEGGTGGVVGGGGQAAGRVRQPIKEQPAPFVVPFVPLDFDEDYSSEMESSSESE